MKKLFAALALSIVFAQSVLAYSWNFPEITQDIQILENSKLRITETIIADFTDESHHGIYREIPVKYRDQYRNYFNLRFKLVSIVDEDGTPQPIAQQGVEGDNYLIKIGDADIWRNDVATYILTYEIDRAVTYFDDHDELYWNVYTYWDVPVLTSSTTVHLPSGASTSDLKATCFTGYYGSTEAQCKAEIIDDKTFKFTNNEAAYPGQGFTIVAGWPKDIVAQPPLTQRIWWYIADNWPVFIPLFAFIFLFLKWWYTGRDPEHKSTVFPRYEPPKGLSALEVGTIIDERVDLRDITAVIIDYAVKGYIKIIEEKEKKFLFTETDYQIEMLKDYKKADGIKEHEIKILDSIFEGGKNIKLSSLKYKFYKHLPDIKDTTYKNLTGAGFFVHNPQNIRNIYMGIGIAICCIMFFGFGFFVLMFGPSFSISMFIAGGLFILFGRVMPRKTLRGAEAYTEIRGLEEYIRTAEKDRIKFQENANIFFEKLLPYAMVLNLADKWADVFKDFYKTPPSWFEGADTGAFNTNYLVNRLTDFTSSANTALASAPRSSGGGSSAWSGGSGFSGGSSGGGFGGGGGGGW